MADIPIPTSPVVVCVENSAGEEVSLTVEPDDDFHGFLDKAKLILGYDLDINSITRNQAVSLEDNIYQFLISSEHNRSHSSLCTQNYDKIFGQNNNLNDQEYVLDDGTQIKASQIHFDNDDMQVDFTVDKIPFVKYIDDGVDDNDDDISIGDVRQYNIVDSPVSRWSSKNSSPKRSFINTLPFKLVCNNASAFESQFMKFVESSTIKPITVAAKPKSPKTVVKDVPKPYEELKAKRTDDFTTYTRDEILNMFKDSPVTLSYETNRSHTEKRRHARKSDPSKLVHKNWNARSISYVDVDGVIIGGTENQNCCICGKFVDSVEKMYLFDNEDQRLHRSSPQKKTSKQLKVICDVCLTSNFRPGRLKSPNQSLNSDEYLVIRNNQQYIFQKINNLELNTNFGKENKAFKDNLQSDIVKNAKAKEKVEFVKVEIGSDGEIVTKPIENELRSPDDVVIVKDENKDSSSDIEIIETDNLDDNIIDNLENADEQVKEFLGKYQHNNAQITELKCRFCENIFEDLTKVMDHVEMHKHYLEDGEVFPCPLCDYGYANVKWLKGHLRAAHEHVKNDGKNTTEDTKFHAGGDGDKKNVNETSPVAKRTRSAAKKSDDEKPKDNSESPVGTHNLETKIEQIDGEPITLKTEVKQEAIESSDDEIWIVQTADDETSEQLKKLLNSDKENEKSSSYRKKHKCFSCSRIFATADALTTHKCLRRRVRKPKGDFDTIIIPSEEDFIKRAQGRPRQTDTDYDDMLVEKSRRKRKGEPSSDPQILTCHNCNESFTSKVRLKFHMQFHEKTSMLSSGVYHCASCPGSCFDTETQLFDHVHFRHHKQTRWQCPVDSCGKTFCLRATLTKHSRTHTDTRRYVCVTCGKRFLDKQTLDEHGVTHLQIKPFQCHICLKQLTRRSRLRMHLRAHEEELIPTPVLACAVCRRAFPDSLAAQEHANKSVACIQEYADQVKEEKEQQVQLSPTSGIVSHTVHVIEFASRPAAIQREMSPRSAAPHLRRLDDTARSIIRVVQIEKAFRCEFCEDVFYLEDPLNSHRAVHKGVKNPFTCHICKVSFATYSRCTTHKTTHGFYKRSLDDAMKSAATDAKAGPSATGILGYGGFPVAKHFLCEDCGRSYLHWTYLQVHRRMKHANENYIYKCNHCDLTFPNSWSIAYHRKKVHGKTGQDDVNGTTKILKQDHKIPCRDCNEVLPDKTALYKHRRKEHSDVPVKSNGRKEGLFWCHTCNKQHTVRLDVQKKQTACAQCGDNLTTEHPNTLGRPRTAPRDWLCSRCPKRFRIRSDLKAHLKLKHPMYLTVIEIQGLNPSLEEVIECLNVNKISRENVIEINKMSFAEGTTSIIPNSARALAMLSSVPKTPVPGVKLTTPQPKPEEFQPLVFSRSHKPNILQRGEDRQSDLSVTEISDVNLQMLLQNGVLVNGNQMVQLQLDDPILME